MSKRVGNYQHHPLFGVLLDQLWVRCSARAVGARKIPPPINRPPTTCIHVIVSDSSTSAKIAAMNGCRFATSVARDGPTLVDGLEPEDVRQHERPEDRVDETEPHQRAEVERLAQRLLDAGDARSRPSQWRARAR